MKKYQIIVIGAGSGGLTAVNIAAQLGAKVALIEADTKLGGDCLHTGCVPSKALIHTARQAWALQQGKDIGINSKVDIDFAKVMQHVTASIKHIETRSDNDEHYQSIGVDVLHGEAEFIDAHTIKIGGQTLTAKRIIIATGSRPAIPKIPGLEDVNYLTNETIFSLQKMPTSLVIIGGGPIGCELGQAFAMLGSKVTIIQSGPKLMPHDEPEVSDLILKTFTDMGINVCTETDIKNITKNGTNIVLELMKAGATIACRADQILVATGRTSTLPIGLEAAGVATNKYGIVVDKQLRTNQKHIYAVGDCNGGPKFTHTASKQAIIAVQHALIGTRGTFDANYIPWATFTTPEVAHFGLMKAQVNDKPHCIFRLDYNEIDRAVTDSEDGSIEVITDKKYRVLGATIVGAESSELMAQIVLLHDNRIPLKNIASTVQTYPTYGLGITQIAALASAHYLSQNYIRKFVKLLLRIQLGKKST